MRGRYAYKSDAILAVDDEIAKDAFQKSLLEMAAPKSMRCLCADDCEGGWISSQVSK